MKKTLLLLLLLIGALSSYGYDREHFTEIIPNPEGKSYIYRLTLKDKKGTPYSLSEPGKYLSEKSVERRRCQGLAVDSTDLPVSPTYLRQIAHHDVNIVGISKWNNTVLVRSANRQALERLGRLPFVKSTMKVW